MAHGRSVTIQAIGPQGWPVAERVVDYVTEITVEDAAEQLRAAVRSDYGWQATIVVRDARGRDITRRYRVN
jgi:hypothetical protein